MNAKHLVLAVLVLAVLVDLVARDRRVDIMGETVRPIVYEAPATLRGSYAGDGSSRGGAGGAALTYGGVSLSTAVTSSTGTGMMVYSTSAPMQLCNTSPVVSCPTSAIVSVGGAGAPGSPP